MESVYFIKLFLHRQDGWGNREEDDDEKIEQ